MKYLKIGYGNCSEVSMDIVCSHCNKAKLSGDEKFCPRCGHKLKPIPPKLGSQELADKLNKVVCGDSERGGYRKEARHGNR